MAFPPLAPLPLLVVAGLLASCAAETYARRADADAQRIVEEGTGEVRRRRRESVVRPGPPPEAPAPDPAETAPPATAPPEPRVLSLGEALELAIAHNRSYAGQKEALLLQALSLADTRHTFSPQLSLTLGYVFADTPGSTSHGVDVSAGLDQILPWGADLRAGVSTGFDDVDGDGNFSTGLSIQLTQPLLRGAGRAISHEPLVQAERSLIYAVREFELFREDFSISVASRYYDLVQRKKSIDNLRQNQDGFVFGRRQAEALFQVGRTNELDVLRARRSELQSKDALIAAEEDLLLALDRFRIFLGLPGTETVDVLPAAPTFVPANFDVGEAITVALANRLDLLNRVEQLEDIERGLRITADGLRPDLSLTTGINLSADPVAGFTNQDLERDSITAGLSFGVPVDRVRQRNSYRAALLGRAQARRSFEEFRDNLIVDITGAFRELERREESLEIQRTLITDQEKNVKIAQLRFEQGDFSNRDVVEAGEALLDARNSLIREQVSYEISRLQLLRDLGILFIDDRGMWTE